MPAGKGKTLLRCSIRADLHAALTQEARGQGLDLGSVVEGHLEHSRLQTRAEQHLMERRLDTLTHGQEQMLRLLESLVTALEGQQGPQIAPEEGGVPPVATYDQMYGPTPEPHGAPGESSTPTESLPTKRSWRPW
jgi:hypothetical protein